MITFYSPKDTDALVLLLREAYALPDAEVRLHRDWIGYVYTVKTQAAAYVLKLYRPFHTRFALNTVGILQYLEAREYPAARIVPAITGEAYVMVRTSAGDAVAMLYDLIAGEDPDVETDLVPIAAQTGILHRVMADYTGEILQHGKAHYIDRYLQILERIEFPQDKLADVITYGAALWERFEQSPRGFCHGDLHCGNMRRDNQKRYWLFDFDAACVAHPAADIATLCDRTDYFHLQEDAFAETQRALDLFMPAYERERGSALVEADVRAVYAFIAIRHYDIQATITDCQGYTLQNLENQHRWLMDWRELCARKGV